MTNAPKTAAETKSAALEWIACRCEQAVSVADCKKACEQCAKLAREALDSNSTGETK